MVGPGRNASTSRGRNGSTLGTIDRYSAGRSEKESRGIFSAIATLIIWLASTFWEAVKPMLQRSVCYLRTNGSSPLKNSCRSPSRSRRSKNISSPAINLRSNSSYKLRSSATAANNQRIRGCWCCEESTCGSSLRKRFCEDKPYVPDLQASKKNEGLNRFKNSDVPHLKVRRSNIDRTGVFTLKPFEVNDFVVEFKGELISTTKADERSAQGWRGKARYRPDWVFILYDAVNVIDPNNRGNIAKFINHSCSPNCYASELIGNKKNKVNIYAKRKIEVNEEITIDYFVKFTPCLCGSSICKNPPRTREN